MFSRSLMVIVKLNQCHFMNFRYIGSKFSNPIKDSKLYENRYNEVLSYLSHCKTFMLNRNNLSPSFYKRYKYYANQLYLMDESVAAQVVDLIKNDLLTGSGHIIEFNPGLGLMSQEILRLNVPSLRLFEPDYFFNKLMLFLTDSFPDKMLIYNTDFLQLWNVLIKDRKDGGERFASLFSGIQEQNWEDEPSMKIIGTLPNEQFLKFVIRNIIFKVGLVEYGRPSFYVFVDPCIFAKMKKLSSYFSLLFPIFFDCEVLYKVDQKLFLPWPLNTCRNKSVVGIDMDKYYFVKLIPKRRLYNLFGDENLLRAFYFFAYQIAGNHSSNFVIATLEKWIPGCGIRFIPLGIGVFTQFIELDPDKILQVFLEFSKCPDFKCSSFVIAMENFLMKENFDDYAINNSQDSRL